MAITLRNTKGSPLTYTEVDTNFTHLSNSVSISVKNYGAVCDGVTDDSAAIQSALNSGAKRVVIHANTAIGTKLTVPEGVELHGAGRVSIKKLANIDMVDLSTNSARMTNIRLEGQGATYTGRGILISDGNDQKIVDCDAVDMNGYALEVSVADKALRLEVRGGIWQRTTTTNPAIKLPGPSSETAGERKFFGLQAAGGNLIDLSGSQNTHLIGCSMENLTFGDNCLKVILSGCRISSAGSDIDIKGQDHVISGGSYAGNLDLNTNATNIEIIRPIIANTYGITDNSGVNNNWYDWQGSFTPTWGADSVNPALGNGTLTGRYVRTGRHMRVMIELTMGSTTTYGTGPWFFQLPSGINQAAIAAAVGSVYALDTGTEFKIGACYTAAGTPKIYMAATGNAANWQSTVPHTWASTDLIKLAIEWEVG